METTRASTVDRRTRENESRRTQHRQYICTLVAFHALCAVILASQQSLLHFLRGLVNPAPGVFDFEGYRSLDTFFKAAYNVGLWVILRPGQFLRLIPVE